MAQRARLPAIGADVTDLIRPAGVPGIGDDVTDLFAAVAPRPRVATPPPPSSTRGMLPRSTAAGDPAPFNAPRLVTAKRTRDIELPNDEPLITPRLTTGYSPLLTVGGRRGRFNFDIPPDTGGTPRPRYAFETDDGGRWNFQLETGLQGGRWEQADHAAADFTRYKALDSKTRTATMAAMWGDNPIAGVIDKAASEGASFTELQKRLKPYNTHRQISEGEPKPVPPPQDTRAEAAARKATGISAQPRRTLTARAAGVARSPAAGVARVFTKPFWGALEAAGDALGLESVAEWSRAAGKQADALVESVRGSQAGAGPTEQAIYSGLESVGVTAPGLVAGAMTGGSAAVALGAMGFATAGESYQEAREAGASPLKAMGHAAVQGVTEVLTEKIPASRLFGDLSKRTTLVKTLLRQAEAEIPGEQVATVVQDLSDWVTRHPDQPLADYLSARPSAAANTLVATLVGTVVQAGGATAVTRLAERVQRPTTAPSVGADVTDLVEPPKSRFTEGSASPLQVSAEIGQIPPKTQEIAPLSTVTGGKEPVSTKQPLTGVRALIKDVWDLATFKGSREEYVKKAANRQRAKAIVEQIKSEGIPEATPEWFTRVDELITGSKVPVEDQINKMADDIAAKRLEMVQAIRGVEDASRQRQEAEQLVPPPMTDVRSLRDIAEEGERRRQETIRATPEQIKERLDRAEYQELLQAFEDDTAQVSDQTRGSGGRRVGSEDDLPTWLSSRAADEVSPDRAWQSLLAKARGEGRPTATFLGWQEAGEGYPAIPLYNVTGGELDGSTVGPDTLKAQVIEVPETPAREVSIPKKEREEHTYSSTQVNLPAEHAEKVVALANAIPDEDLAADGRAGAAEATAPHVTVKYGIHTSDVEAVRKVLADEPPVRVTLGATSFFPNGESGSGDVLKIDVDSPDLHRLNAKVAAALKTTDTHPQYTPHVTVAYLKPGKGKAYEGDDSLKGQTMTLDRVRFSTAEGKIFEIPLTGTTAQAAPADMTDEEMAAEIIRRVAAKEEGTAPTKKPVTPQIPSASGTKYVLPSSATAGAEKTPRAGPSITYNTRLASVEVAFPGRPERAVLDKLKAAGFRWAKGNKVWYQRDTAKDEGRAIREVRDLLGLPAPEKGFTAPPAKSGYELGQSAFAAGVKRVVPADVPRGQAEAWYQGWDAANLAAPVPGVSTPSARYTKGQAVEMQDFDGKWYPTEVIGDTDPKTGFTQVWHPTMRMQPMWPPGAPSARTAVSVEATKLRVKEAAATPDKKARLIPTRRADGTVEYKVEVVQPESESTTPAPGDDLDARKAANKATRDALFAKLNASLNRTKSGVDPADVTLMVGILRTYLDDGIVEFERAWRQFLSDFDRAARLTAHFETAWEMLRGETRTVGSLEAPAAPSVEVPAEQRTETLFTAFRSSVQSNTLPKDPRELRKLAQSVVGGDPTTYTDDITDAVEAALTAGTAPVNRETPLLAQILHAQADEAKLPRAARTLEKTDLQQFSTPLPLAVAAQYVADVRAGDTVLEPTAGTGHLISGVDPGQVLAAELSPRRARLLRALGFNVSEGDYLKNLDLKAYADVIITNPPWGKYTTGKYGTPVGLAFRPGDVAERFIAKNLRDLKDGGRLVAVMPTTMLGPSGHFFRTHLLRSGQVVALVKSPPHAYDTRSTSVESVLLVFDKDPSPAGATWPTLVEPASWSEYAEAVAAIPRREARRVESERPTERPTEGRPPAALGTAPTAVRAGTREPPGTGEPGSAPSGGTPVVPPGRDADVVAAEQGRERERLEPPPPARRAPRASERESTRGLSGAAINAYRAAQGSRFFAPYRLRSALRGVRHPKLVVEARNLSGIEYPELTIELTPRAAKIVKDGRLSVEQAEQAMAVVQANVIHQHGYLAADNVGVGKSREIALTIIDLMDRAKAADRPLRLLVTTKSADNITDLIDNELLGAVLQGRAPGFEIVRVPDLKASKPRPGETTYEPLPQHERAIYVTDFYNLAPYRLALMDVGLHGILGDEAHRFKNADAAVGGTWQQLHAGIMLHVPRQQQVFGYFTATPAQSVYDYQYLYGLRLWPIDGFNEWVMVVTGQANDTQAAQVQTATDQGGHDLATVATGGGENVVGSDAGDVEVEARSGSSQTEDVFASRLTPSEAEQIPREWKMLGRFSSRDLWRAGTDFVVHTATLPEVAKERYDKFAQLARDIIDASERFGRMDRSGRASRFGPKAALQAAAKRIQMQPALEEAIRIAQEHIATGHQAVLSVINVSEMDPNEGNIAAAINQINTRHVEGDQTNGFVDIGEIPEALIVRAELLEQAQALGTLPDPLTMISDAFGAERVAFVVGASAGTRAKQVQEFQAGTRDVAVISAAGSTGISLDHRVKTDTPAGGRRVFIDVQYEWSASEAIQRYGRVDRAAQISPPKIMALNFGSASEKKFLATVANRMASLGALSKGGAESTGASALEEFEIAGQDALIAARDAWAEQSEEERALWRGRPFRDPRRAERPAVMTRASMREINLALLWLPTDVANRYWESFITNRARVRELMGYADEARTKAMRGEVLREVEVASDLTLYQVKNEAGHRFGVLQGVVMPKMPRLRRYLFDPDGNVKRSYVNFTDTSSERVVSGLEIPWTRIAAVAEEFGASVQGEAIDTPEKAAVALKAGDVITLQHRSEGKAAPWQLRQRKDGKIAIDNAVMADRDLLLRHGAGYSPVGNFWHVTDLVKFLERFPAEQPKAAPAEKGAAETALEALDAIEEQAKARIGQRGTFKGGRLAVGLPLDDATDLVIIGAAKIAKGTIQFAQWSAEMVRDFGERIQPHLAELYQKAILKAEAIGPIPLRQPRAGHVIPPAGRIPEERLHEFPSIQKMPVEIRRDIEDLLNRYHGFEAQRRGVQPWARTTELAKDVWLPLETLRPGKALNAEELNAYQTAIATALTMRKPLLEKLKDGTATDWDRLQTSHLTDVATVLTASYRGAKAEAGRALNILRAKGRVLDLRESAFLERALQAPGFDGDLTKLSKEALDAAGDPLKQLTLLRRRTGTGFDLFLAYYYGNLLSGIKTQERNIIGNSFNMVANLVTPVGAVPIDLWRSAQSGQPRTVFLGEMPRAVVGSLVGIESGLRNGYFTFVQGFRPRTIAAARLGQFDTPRVELPGGLKNPWNIPGRALEAADEFFRAIAHHQELYASTYAQARQEGLTDTRRIRDRMAELMAATDPTTADGQIANALMERVTAFEDRAVFQEPAGPVVRALMKLKGTTSPLPVRAAVTFIMPFIRISGSITRQGFEYSPAGFAMRGATGKMGTGRVQSQAQGRALIGSLALLPMAWLAATGRLTGAPPDDPGEREEFYAQGKLANAVKIGKYWVRYVLFQPFSVPMSAVANAWNTFKASKQDEGAAQEAMAAAVAGAGASVLDQSFLSGLGTILDAVNDPQRYAGRWLSLFAQGFVPLSGLMRNITQAGDPVVRRPQGVAESVKAIVPSQSSTIQPRRTRTGAPVTRPGGWVQRGFVVPEVSQEIDDTLTATLARVGYQPLAPRPQLTLRGERVPLTSAQEDVLIEALGRERKWMLETAIHRQGFTTRSDDVQLEILERASANAGRAVRARALRVVRQQMPFTLDRLVSAAVMAQLAHDSAAVLGPEEGADARVAR